MEDANPSYDITKAEDIGRAFRDFMNECIYGAALEELVQRAGETDNLDDHEPMIKAVHEFVLVK